MKKYYRYIILIFAIISLSVISSIDVFAASSGDYCYDTTRSITKASIDYLNEIYIKKYPNLGTGYLYGSEADKAVLKKMTDKIVSGLNTDKQKIDAIANWVAKNVKYRSITANTYQYPIDVFYHREGNCVGTSQLIRHMARSIGIPVVICDGTRGDMKKYIKLGTREMDHEWVMAYVGNEWLLYDPLFEVFGVSDEEFISNWYFTDHIEGVSPYYEGMDYIYVNYGDAIFYVDGRFMHYVNGIPGSQFYGNVSKGGTATNGCISYFANTFYDAFADDNCYGNDGFLYLENDERRYDMINDQCYSNGWLTYGNGLHYAKENGIMLANQFIEKDGKVLFAPYDGSMLEIKGYTDNIETTDGYITIHKDIDKIKLIPAWADAEKSIGRVIVWENVSNNADLVNVDDDGNITVLGEGLATLVAMSKDPDDSDGHHLADFVQVYVTKDGYRKYSYEDTPADSENPIETDKTADTVYQEPGTTTDYQVKEVTLSATSYTFDGKVKTPAVTIKDINGNTLKKDTDYRIIYPSGRKYVGVYTYKIILMGNYSGTLSKNFTIKPKIKKLKAMSKGITVYWKKQAEKSRGYQIQVATDAGFKKNVKNFNITKNSATKKLITGLNGSKKYYVRIRVKIVTGAKKTVYSSWSKTMTIKTKK